MELSVLIASYKRKDFLKRNLSIVFDQIDRDELRDIEVIVSVNPSGDGTEEYLASLPKKPYFKFHVNSKNIGGINNMYGLIRMASGKYIWLLGDDDEISPGTLKRVLDAITRYPDIGWIFLNLARLNNNKDGSQRITYFNNELTTQYYDNGLVELEKIWKKSPGNVLFQSSNIYLREPTLEVIDLFPANNRCPWVYYIFNSIHNKGAYIISELSILQGVEQTWTDSYYQITCLQFQQMILSIGDLPYYSKLDAKNKLRYYMTHEGMVYWLYLFKWMTRNKKEGLRAYKFYMKEVPITTIFMTLFLPFEILYLLFRHYIIRELKRRKTNRLIADNNDLIPDVWRKYLSC